MTTETGMYGGRKIRQGTVVSDKMDKTVVVAVQSNIRHRLYKKTIRREKKFMAHDENETAKMGDVVRIVERSPVSRHKRWAVIEVVQRAELPDLAPGQIDLELIGEVKREAPEPEAVASPAAEAAAAPEVTAEAEAAAPPKVTAEPEAEEAAEVAAEDEPAASLDEIEPVLEDAAPEALDVMADIDSAESVQPEEPEVPPAEEAEVVMVDASEALEVPPAHDLDAEEEAK